MLRAESYIRDRDNSAETQRLFLPSVATVECHAYSRRQKSAPASRMNSSLRWYLTPSPANADTYERCWSKQRTSRCAVCPRAFHEDINVDSEALQCRDVQTTEIREITRVSVFVALTAFTGINTPLKYTDTDFLSAFR